MKSAGDDFRCELWALPYERTHRGLADEGREPVIATDRPPSRAPKFVNVTKLLGDLPDLGSLGLICDTEPLRGKVLTVAPNCDWEADTLALIRPKTVPAMLKAISPAGTLELSMVQMTRTGGGQPAGGVAGSAVIRRSPNSVPSLFRTYIKCGSGLGRVCYLEATPKITSRKSEQLEGSTHPSQPHHGRQRRRHLKQPVYEIGSSPRWVRPREKTRS